MYNPVRDLIRVEKMIFMITKNPFRDDICIKSDNPVRN